MLSRAALRTQIKTRSVVPGQTELSGSTPRDDGVVVRTYIERAASVGSALAWEPTVV